MKACQSLKNKDMALRLCVNLVYLQSTSVLKAIILCKKLFNESNKVQLTIDCLKAYIFLINCDIDAFARLQTENRIVNLQAHFILISILYKRSNKIGADFIQSRVLR